MLAVVALGLVPAAISLLVDDSGIPAWVSVAAFVAGGMAAGFVSRAALASFRCPRCDQSIARHEPTRDALDAPIQYHCAGCDVVWDSGLRTPSSS